MSSLHARDMQCIVRKRPEYMGIMMARMKSDILCLAALRMEIKQMSPKHGMSHYAEEDSE